MLSCLSRNNQGTKHQKLRKLCHLNTGLWLVLCNSYRAWLNSQSSASLCLHGIPGSGKSVLASIVIEDIRDSRKEANLSYHYCDYSDKRSLEPANILSALTHGLLSRIEIPTKVAEDIARAFQDGGRMPDIDEVLQILSATVAEFDSVTFVLDGLDEVGELDRLSVCGALRGLITDNANTVIRLFITSRDNATSTLFTPTSSTFRVQASPDALALDINSFIRHSVRGLIETGRLRIRESELEEIIVQSLIRGAKGMYVFEPFTII